MNGRNQLFLEEQIKTYAHDLLSDHVKAEYDYQINEWKKYINQVVDAERDALKNQETVLSKVLNEKQKADQISAMLAMFALSLLTGPALSWISGTIQYKLFPALASTKRLKTTQAYIAGRMKQGTVFGQTTSLTYSESDYNKVMSKIFGDAGKDLAKPFVDYLASGVKKVPSRKTGRSYQELSAIALISKNANSDDLHQSLKTRLENALLDEQTLTTRTILDLALEVRRSESFGKNVLEHLYKTQPQTARMDDGAKLLATKKFIEKIVDVQRHKWAASWFYYGNDPPPATTREMSRKIEREIWAMWILDQTFQLVEYTSSSYSREGDSEMSRFVMEGRDKIPFHKLIVNRLIDLGVVLPQTSRQLAELNDRNLSNTSKERPNVLVKGAVDTKQELTEIHNWAKNHTPDLISGSFDSYVRMLESVIHVHK